MTNKIIIFFLAFIPALSSAQQNLQQLKFDITKYELKRLTLRDKTFDIRVFEKIVYVQNPVDSDYQVINIYIPEEYFNNKSVNNYISTTAPIFFPNRIGGYLPSKPASSEIKTIIEALAHGYIVASAGARGRTMKNGKAPAAIVDLKAAIRYLKFNDKNMPGDANKIVSNGTSAGGAMSALLGATGNNADYEPHLKALGAAPTSDDIFAVSAYCPITDLDNGDKAYEWQFNDILTYKKRGPMAGSNVSVQMLTKDQVTISKDLKASFSEYVNNLKLKDDKNNLLVLDATGNGSFKDLVKSYIVASANIAIANGNDLSGYKWLTFIDARVVDLDWDYYIAYMERLKTPPAFDASDLSSPETQEFGTEAIDKQHFTQYGKEHSIVVGSSLADKHIVKMMNPLYYIGDHKAKTCVYWRIRHGSKDRDGSLATPVILATLLENKGYNVSLEFPWNQPHGGDYDLSELFKWIDEICKDNFLK